MKNLKELTDFLKTRENGASFSELKEVFSNEEEIKNFIKTGLSNEVIFKNGEKRGTRYYALGKTPTNSTPTTKTGVTTNKTEKSSEVESEDDLDRKDLEVYLKSDKPIHIPVTITEVTYFGDDNPSIKKFLQSGMIVTHKTIGFDKQTKRNTVINTEIVKHYNKIAFRHEGRKFLFVKYNMKNVKEKTEIETFSDYEEFREYVRANLI